MATNDLTPERVNPATRPEGPNIGYPAGLVAVLFDKLDKLTEKWGSLLVYIGLFTGLAMAMLYLARENPIALVAIATVYVVAIGAAIFARLKKL